MKKIIVIVMLISLSFNFTEMAYCADKNEKTDKNNKTVTTVETKTPVRIHIKKPVGKRSESDDLKLRLVMATLNAEHEKVIDLVTIALNKGEKEKIFTTPQQESEAYTMRGSSESALGRIVEAEHDFEIATDLDPKNYSAYDEKTILYCRQKDYKKALKNSLMAVETSGKYISYAYNNLAMVYLYLKEYDKALETVNKSLAIDSTKGNPNDTKGDILLHMGRAGEALEYFNKAIAKSTSIVPIYNRGLCYLALGNKDAAIKDFEKVVTRGGENAYEAQMQLNKLRK